MKNDRADMEIKGRAGIRFISPVDGDMFHARDGVICDGSANGEVAGDGLANDRVADGGSGSGDGLLIDVVVAAPAESLISVGGIRAVMRDGDFTAPVLLKSYENRIEVRDEATGETAAITVYRLTDFAGHYRLSIDDNIWFLRDLHEHTNEYKSIFDNPYLAFLKEVHELYGTKIHLNIFYETDRFNLSMLSDRFRSEWQAQAGWIRLSFHALGEFPDEPYRTAGYETVKRDCGLVMKEIDRFAGAEVTGPMTTIHWGATTAEGARALRDLGYKALLGYFNVDDDRPAVSFYLDEEQRRHIKRRWIWKDNQQDLIFVRSSICIDKAPLAEIGALLDSYGTNDKQPPCGVASAVSGISTFTGPPPYVDLLVHEQYFYPSYEAYQPDYRERVRAAVKWAYDKGYTPAFLSECIFK